MFVFIDVNSVVLSSSEAFNRSYCVEEDVMLRDTACMNWPIVKYFEVRNNQKFFCF